MRIAVPNKGRLHDPAMDLLERAGLHVVDGADRKLYADTVDPDVTVLLVRAADIAEYVSAGAADLGITGLDQVREAATGNVVDLLDLEFGRCRLVVAAPEDGDVESVEHLEGRTVATEFPTIAREHFVEMADAILDITSTGTTLRVNRLAVIDEVLESSARLFAREDVVDDPKTQQVRMALSSVLTAEGKRYLMMNVPEDRLEAVEDVIPGLGGPTVMDIAGKDALAVHAVVDEQDVFETINALKAEGASDVLVTEIERLVE